VDGEVEVPLVPSADEMMPCTSCATESFGPAPGAAVLPSLALA
jgi:hypothetical protein